MNKNKIYLLIAIPVMLTLLVLGLLSYYNPQCRQSIVLTSMVTDRCIAMDNCPTQTITSYGIENCGVQLEEPVLLLGLSMILLTGCFVKEKKK